MNHSGGRARSLAVFGTGSDVGKSVIAAGLCRLFQRTGVRVAPFKAQNMSLNSFVTEDGGEMGRAQALQATACGIAPHVDMNPILLKPESDRRAQVIVHGKVFDRQDAAGYGHNNRTLFGFIRDSYDRLAGRFDVLVIEGAGSAAEINLRDRDLANWIVAELADAPVILVANIDTGGVFAQLIGTMDLLSPAERRRVLGVIVNKFRGDEALFRDGITVLQERTGVPVLGVVPFVQDLRLDQEDGVEIERRSVAFRIDRLNIAVVLLPRMSNFTDFNALAAEPDVALKYVRDPRELDEADAVIIPGTKNTIDDLQSLRERGFPRAIERHVERGGHLVGICGGYQMLGQTITDPGGLESGGSAPGLGLLDVATVLEHDKITAQVMATSLMPFASPDVSVAGYHIHLGRTRRFSGAPCFRITAARGCLHGMGGDESEDGEEEGTLEERGQVWGTYLHGVFDDARFRRLWLNALRTRKGLPPCDLHVSESVTAALQSELDRWADHLARHLDLAPVMACVGVGRID
jgi:adenosylcobyric acid synthase